MKKIWYSFLLLLCFAPVWAENISFKKLLKEAQPFVQKEITSARTIPTSLIALADEYSMVISSQKSGGVAEYKPKKDRIYIFEKELRPWSEKQVFTAPDELARCLAPVFLHELTHARNQQFAQAHSFVWPVTLSDEYIAVFWQVHFIQENLQQDPHYYDRCHGFMPPADFLNAKKEDLPAVITDHYLKTNAHLPPPLTAANLQALQENKKILWHGYLFQPKRRILSVKSLFQKGGDWTTLRPKQLPLLLSSSLYQIYVQQNTLLNQEIRSLPN